MKKIRNVLLLMLVLQLSLIGPALADTVSNQTRSEVRTIKASLKKLKRIVNKSNGRIALTNISSKGLDDSDGDGLPDVYENALGSSSCDDDSDDDGISDDEEGNSGSDPDDSSSGEIEIKGLISAISETTVTVDGKIFTVDSNTEYGRGATSLASFGVGNRVEVNGRLLSGILTLRKIKTED